MTDRISVETMWSEFTQFALKGIHPDSIQYRESKKIFFCGVAQSLFLFREIVGQDSMSIDEGVEILEGVNNEIYAFLDKECKDWELKK